MTNMMSRAPQRFSQSGERDRRRKTQRSMKVGTRATRAEETTYGKMETASHQAPTGFVVLPTAGSLGRISHASFC